MKKVVIGQVNKKGVSQVQQILFSKEDKDYEEIAEVEENTLEELEKYEAYKRARNERVKEKFKGSER